MLNMELRDYSAIKVSIRLEQSDCALKQVLRVREGSFTFLLHQLFVRDVIYPDGSSDRFPDPRRALIGGAYRFAAVGPPSRSAI
jgi:hypothetical protein